MRLLQNPADLLTFASAIALGALLAGCQEYNIKNPAPAYNGANPPDLENPINIDRIVQLTQPSADVLWVVDSSSSMRDNQRALGENFPLFMDYFLGSGLDYHIGVITTDMLSNAHKGKLVAASNGEKYITPESEDAMGMFQDMSQVGIAGSGDEQGRAPVYSAFELQQSYNAGFLREDPQSGIHIIIVSDEDDHTPGTVITKDEFVEYLNGLRPRDELVTFNTIVNPPGVWRDEPGVDYIYVADRVGGIKQSIAEPDWVRVLEQLGIQAAGLKREFFLSHLPVVDSIEVQVQLVDGTVIPFADDQYTYSDTRNSVTFKEFIPDPLSQVYIQYTILASMVAATDEG